MKVVLNINPLSPAKKTVYLLYLTLGCACMVSGILWMTELGCAIILSGQLLSGRFSGGGKFSSWFGYGIIVLALASGTWMFVQAHRHGNTWLRTPPPWWWDAFIGFVWLMNVVVELRRTARKTLPPSAGTDDRSRP